MLLCLSKIPPCLLLVVYQTFLTRQSLFNALPVDWPRPIWYVHVVQYSYTISIVTHHAIAHVPLVSVPILQAASSLQHFPSAVASPTGSLSYLLSSCP